MYSVFSHWMFWQKKQAFHCYVQWPQRPCSYKHTWHTALVLPFQRSLLGGVKGEWWAPSEKKSVLAFLLTDEHASFFLIGSFAISAWIKCLNSSTAHILSPQGSFSSPAWLLAFDHNLFISSRPHPKNREKTKQNFRLVSCSVWHCSS